MVAVPAERAVPFTQHRDDDNAVSVRAYAASPLHVVKHCLELDGLDRWREDHPDRPYRNSGLWSIHREWVWDSKMGRRVKKKQELTVTIDVGCWHEHDCCGCMCRLHHSITTCGGFTIVVTTMGFNY